MKKLLLLCLTAGLFLIGGSNANAQSYENAIGVRIGPYNGVNFKTFLNTNKALDLNLSVRSNDNFKRFLLTGLYEVHNPIGGAPGLLWYYGGGGSIGSYKVKNFEGDLFLSADGVLGLDYKFDGVPLNLAVDWRPRLELTPDTNFGTGDVGLAIRLTF
ncbi:hypothetical protein [Daejeonella lutea]|uniref:Outer membrane protein beta-barrel domain-containing protein n=1 Tax=Daejeonella lutea TaxID=572036 RepID=A0A1T5EFP0_9SPHI|nr:hypothetical protein [Daejeonella lutea]SKB82721.1 hypothetical protein SAMN05661099_2963 [Daejeonella lutea]